MAKATEKYFLSPQGFHSLLARLKEQNYNVIGPRIVEGEFVYAPLASAADLPVGWTDRQEGGVYRLEKRGDDAFFGYGVGQHSWKQFLFPPNQRVWKSRRRGDAWDLAIIPADSPPFAFIGVRACDIQAIEVLDRVFLRGNYVDPTYAARRSQALVVAVNCTQPGGTCFCASMGTGPRATFGFDLALTEVLDNGSHYFVAETGTPRGAELLAGVAHRLAEQAEITAADRAMDKAASSMGRQLDTDGLKELLYRNYEHPRWDDVASRCLTCGNCTMVCPTCFCHTYQDFFDLNGESAERRRHMQVCFTLDFSYIHGGSVRSSPLSRYRQWLTHKLATWLDQFGCFGCVGCGRCITWCPVAIDITEEAAAIRERDGEKRGSGG
ncbi:MAG: 4Fe-4S dicluster domain-containing protein [Deltaproteobacteria bacterium]|nr:4Fe-4S dicluster domain-containing protein [Deltaproteobacteria bacterium]